MTCKHKKDQLTCVQCDGHHEHVWSLGRAGQAEQRCGVCFGNRCLECFRKTPQDDWTMCQLRDGHIEPHDFGAVWVPVR